MKGWSIVLLAIALVGIVTAYSEALSADPGSEGEPIIVGNFEFEIQQGDDVELVSYHEPKDAAPERVEIPETITVHYDSGDHTFTVVEICTNAFNKCQSVKTVVIPKSVKIIDTYAFNADCIGCFEVDTDNMNYYGTDGVLFDWSHNLICYPPAKTSETYSIPTNVHQIIAGAFSGAQHLKEVSVGENVLLIGEYAFEECSSLETVSFRGSGPSLLGSGAFYSCTNLKSIILPPDLVSIGEFAFGECSSLGEIKIPDDVTYIGEGVFYNCISLSLIELENNLKYSICDHALCAVDSQSRNTTLIAFPAACTDSKGAYVTDYTIPATIDDVREYAFSGSHIKNLTISPGMTAISMLAFAEMKYLENVDIPKTISKIDYGAFMDCTSLKSVDVGVNTYLIGSMAFSGCTSLTKVVLHENLNTIGTLTFSNTSIESIVIPSSVTELGPYVFNYCSKLTYVQIDSKNVYAYNAFDMNSVSQEITVKCYSGALKDLNTVSDNVTFVNFEKRTFPMMNLVGIAVCLLLLALILNFLRRI